MNRTIKALGGKNHKVICTSFLLLLFVNCCLGQNSSGILKGKIYDATTYRTLANTMVVSETSGTNKAITGTDGSYTLKLVKGEHTISFSTPGFQKKIITKVVIDADEVSHLNIVLYPVATESKSKWQHPLKDSVIASDTVWETGYKKELSKILYNNANFFSNIASTILPEYINTGTDKNGLLLLKRLNGVIINESPLHPALYSFTVNGMGERYNQLFYNGAPVSSADPLNRLFPLELLPVEAIENVTVKKTADAALPADYAGGNIYVKTKDFTDKNFYYLLAGSGFAHNASSINFYGDNKSQLEFSGLSGKHRNLPYNFPTTRSVAAFNSLTPQEQENFSKQLNNNITPESFGKNNPNQRVVIGMGKKIAIKKGGIFSVMAFITHTKTEEADANTTQALPDMLNNPYPFTTTKRLITAQSQDSNFRYAAQTAVMINTAIQFGKNKITFKNFLGTQFTNTLIKRNYIYKPNEDTAANAGINYKPAQRYFINTQLAGEHSLNANGKLKLNWQATYNFIDNQNPDERNYLLRKDFAGTKFEIATPYVNNSFLNSGRLWRRYKDKNFNAGFNLSVPLNLFGRPQILNGGIYIQQDYRVSNADMLLVKGSGYFTLPQLLSPERFSTTGGAAISSYFVNTRVSTILFLTANQNTKSSYSGSLNIGATYLKLTGRITNSLHYNIGSRLETSTTLASDIFYFVSAGSTKAEFLPNYKNTKTYAVHLLPSASLTLKVIPNLHLNAAWFKTVNRPQLQELVTYAYYDAPSFAVKTGNPILDMTDINNYSAGVQFLSQSFFTAGINAYYKKITQPVEYITESYGTGNVLFKPHNTPEATVKGIEADVNLKLGFLNISWLKNSTLFANGNITRAKAAAGPVRSLSTPFVKEHTLSGTPNYSINAGFTVKHNRLPQVTVIYSKTGDYITALGSGKEVLLSNGEIISAMPDMKVKGRQHLDVQLAQKIFKSRLEITIGANNLLNNPYVIYQDLNGNDKFDAPLTLETANGAAGRYKSGTDNAVNFIKPQRIYYITFSWLFK